MKRYLVILNDTQGVPDFFHPSEIMGESARQVKQIISEDTPLQYIQGVYTPEQYLQYVQSPSFFTTISSFNPNMPKPALQNKIANIVNYVKSLVSPNNIKQQEDLEQLAGVTGGGDLPQEENFDIDTRTAPAPQYVINPQPSNIKDGDINTKPFGKAPQVPEPQVIYTSYPPQVKDPKTGKLVYVDELKSTPVKTEVKYFTESGIKFKLENGELYKKEWTDTPIEPYMDKVTDPKTGEEKEVEIIPDFRLVNKETGKPVKLSKYVLQQAIWKKLES